MGRSIPKKTLTDIGQVAAGSRDLFSFSLPPKPLYAQYLRRWYILASILHLRLPPNLSHTNVSTKYLDIEKRRVFYCLPWKICYQEAFCSLWIVTSSS